MSRIPTPDRPSKAPPKRPPKPLLARRQEASLGVVPNSISGWVATQPQVALEGYGATGRGRDPPPPAAPVCV